MNPIHTIMREDTAKAIPDSQPLLRKNRASWPRRRSPFACARLLSPLLAPVVDRLQKEVEQNTAHAGYQRAQWLHTTLATINSRESLEILSGSLPSVLGGVEKGFGYLVEDVLLSSSMTVLLMLQPIDGTVEHLREWIRSSLGERAAIPSVAGTHIHHCTLARITAATNGQLQYLAHRLPLVFREAAPDGCIVPVSHIDILHNHGAGDYSEFASLAL